MIRTTNPRAELDRAFEAIWDHDRGGVVVDGEAFFLMHRYSFSEIQREIEAILGRGAEGILLRAGYERGRAFAARLGTLVGGAEEPFLEGLRVFARLTGLFCLEHAGREGVAIRYRATNSFIGHNYGTNRAPVCHYLRGFLLAATEPLLHTKDLVCKEVRCEACGDEDCTFEVAPMFGSPKSGDDARSNDSSPR